MTPLKKPVKRRSEAFVRDRGKFRPLVVTLYPNDTIGLRLAGSRKEEVTALTSVYHLAVKQRVAKEMAEKREKRKNVAFSKRKRQ